jgi:hypothetical protein
MPEYGRFSNLSQLERWDEHRFDRWLFIRPPTFCAFLFAVTTMSESGPCARISTRDSPPVIGPFYAYFAVFRRPHISCNLLQTLLINVLKRLASAVQSQCGTIFGFFISP